MKKSEAIRIVNNRLGMRKLTSSSTTFANISISPTRSGWWMNIKLENFTKDWNILLVGEKDLIILKIPANTFVKPEKYFRIWESKNAVDLLISSDPQDRYFKDISSGSSEVEFKPFIVDQFDIPEMQLKSQDITVRERKRNSRKAAEITVQDLQQKPRQSQRIIKYDETNVSYQELFGGHLRGANKITIQDPYIRFAHQFKNLLEFCLMLGKNKKPEEEIDLEIVTWNEEVFLSQSKENLEDIMTNVSNLGINFSYRFEDIHDRYIESNNGWKIILGRGLDIFQKSEGRFTIADIDQMHRKCKACEITYLRT